MPINKRKDGWYWGKQGPFGSRKKAEEVAQAAHASGYNKMTKAYGEPYKQEKKSKDTPLKTMQAMQKEGAGAGGVASTGATGDTTGGLSYGNPTHGSQKTKKLKAWLDKQEMTTFTSNDVSEEGYPEEANSKKRLKDSSGIERAGKFLDDYSPDVNKISDEEATKQYKQTRRRSHDHLLPGVPSTTTDIIPTHSHKPMAKSLVIELIEYARTELKKAPMRATGASADPVYAMENNPHQPWKKVDNKAGMGEQDTVPVKTANDNSDVTNLGQAGGLDLNARGLANPADDDGSAGRVRGSIPKKEHKKNKPTMVTTEMDGQSGHAMQGMQKGIGYVYSGTNPKQKTESATDYKHPQDSHTENKGELDLDAHTKEKDWEERTKKYKRANKENEESGPEPPLDMAGATAASITNPVTQLMMKWKGNGEYGIMYDSLQRGGDHDRISERDDEELDEEVEKMVLNSIAKNFMRRSNG